MSTVRLKKPYSGHKAGDEISVPFGKGKELITLGIAEYPAAVAAQAQVATGDTAELVALRKRAAQLDAENRDLKTESAELKRDLDKAIAEKKAAEKALAEKIGELAKK